MFSSRPKTMEKRDTDRNRVLKSGAIEFNGGAIDCVVRNISETGAALDVGLGLLLTKRLVERDAPL